MRPSPRPPAAPAPASSAVHLQRLTVRYEYPVYFTAGIFAPGNPLLRQALAREEPRRRHRVLAVVDRAVAAAWPRLLADIARYAARHRDGLVLAAEPVVVEGGERAKADPAALRRLTARLHAAGLDRQSFVLAVGGGALLDVAGYAAATVHRGVRLVRAPTTVLAQADSGVGVKNGVNAFGKKNFLGTFAPPFAVLNDRRFLETLGRRDLVAGMAEAVKVALIRDAAFFDWLEAHAAGLAAGDLDLVATLVERSARLHLAHIAASGDPFEFGSARPLDYGHWAAHKLEALSAYRLRHGEAVAIGMALDARYAVEVGLLAEPELARLVSLLARLGLPLWDDALARAGRRGRPLVLDGLAEFREHLGGELTVTLLERIGRGVEVHEIDERAMRRALDWLRRRHAVR